MNEEKLPESWSVNVSQTLLANSMWVVMTFLIGVFAWSALNMSSAMVDESMKLMGLVFTLFFTLKLLSWQGGPIIIMYDKNCKYKRQEIVHGGRR